MFRHGALPFDQQVPAREARLHPLSHPVLGFDAGAV